MFINATGCTGLKVEWRNTIATTTTFPVVHGTVVEVKCSDTGALNSGSSIVTCITQTQFTYAKEPSCSTPGKLNELYQISIYQLINVTASSNGILRRELTARSYHLMITTITSHQRLTCCFCYCLKYLPSLLSLNVKIRLFNLYDISHFF